MAEDPRKRRLPIIQVMNLLDDNNSADKQELICDTDDSVQLYERPLQQNISHSNSWYRKMNNSFNPDVEEIYYTPHGYRLK